MSNILVECKNLKKYFDTPYGKLHAVDNVSFTINDGETLGIVGESGCGKSTLGRVLIGLLPITDGKILFKGQEIQDLKKEEFLKLRREIQIIFQDPYSSLNPRMTVSQLIAEPFLIHGIYQTKIDLEDRISELMETVGLADRYVNTYPHEMDGGRRQRVGIARALALRPKFIVCDEPVSALDVSIQAQVLNLMMDLQEELKLTYLFITHNMSVVKHISNNIGVMYLGQLVEKADSDELFENPIHPYTQALLKAIPVPALGYKNKLTNALKGEVVSPIEPKPGCRFAPRCPYASGLCENTEPELIEIEFGHYVSCHLHTKSKL